MIRSSALAATATLLLALPATAQDAVPTPQTAPQTTPQTTPTPQTAPDAGQQTPQAAPQTTIEQATPEAARAAPAPGVAPDARDQRAHDWLPEQIVLPQDIDVVIDSAVGGSTRILQFSTAEDAEALIAVWREALRQSGWQIDESQELIQDQQLLFSGPGISSGQIIVIPSQRDGAQVVQIDASMTNE